MDLFFNQLHDRLSLTINNNKKEQEIKDILTLKLTGGNSNIKLNKLVVMKIKSSIML